MSAFGTYLYTYASLCLSALVLCSGIFLISCLAVRKRSGVSPKRQALWFVTLWYLISLSMILFTTGHSGENDVNLYPLRSIYSAVADTGVSLSQLIVLTSGLFVPFGFLLMLVIRRRPLQYLLTKPSSLHPPFLNRLSIFNITSFFFIVNHTTYFFLTFCYISPFIPPLYCIIITCVLVLGWKLFR